MDRQGGFPDALAPEGQAVLPDQHQADALRSEIAASDAWDAALPAAMADEAPPASEAAGAGKSAVPAPGVLARAAWSRRSERWAELASAAEPCRQA